MPKSLVFSTTIKASGAIGEALEERSQLQNKRTAFRRMAETKKFQTWAKMKAFGLPTIDEIVDKQMADENLLIESL